MAMHLIICWIAGSLCRTREARKGRRLTLHGFFCLQKSLIAEFTVLRLAGVSGTCTGGGGLHWMTLPEYASGLRRRRRHERNGCGESASVFLRTAGFGAAGSDGDAARDGSRGKYWVRSGGRLPRSRWVAKDKIRFRGFAGRAMTISTGWWGAIQRGGGMLVAWDGPRRRTRLHSSGSASRM